LLVDTRHTETVRRAFDLFEAGDVDALVGLYHPQVRLRFVGVLQAPALSVHGVESARTYLRGLVAEGVNCAVEELELTEVDGDVLVGGRATAPANALMRWRFDFEDDLIRRVEPLVELGWAPIGSRDFESGEVAGEPEGGNVLLRLGDGRFFSVPIAPELVTRVRQRSPVLVYFDGRMVAGWYLPGERRGMILR
jgi:ketosteroid isomerase-like protein